MYHDLPTQTSQKYAQAARVRALGPSRANPRRRRVSGLDSELELRLAGLGPGRGLLGWRGGPGRVGVGPTDYTYSLPM